MKRNIALAVVMVLAGCATAAPVYGPATTASSAGYVDTQIEDGRWRVSYQGSRSADRDKVETYLLYRAAELTLSQNYDWFETVSRNTDAKTSTVYGGPAYHPAFGLGYGRLYDPWWVDWQLGRSRWDTETRYVATAEIVMGKGAKPADNPRAYEAKEVLAHLRGKVGLPGQ